MKNSNKWFQQKRLAKYSVFDIIGGVLPIYLCNGYIVSPLSRNAKFNLSLSIYVCCSEGPFACHAFIRFQGHLQGPVTITPNADR